MARTIWALAWPVIVTFLLESLVGLIDTLMVGRLGASSVAGVGVGAQILSSVSVAMTAVGTGTLALVARHVGARDLAGAESILGQSITTAFALSVVVVVPVILEAPRIVGWFGVSPEVIGEGVAFTRAVMLSIPQSAALFVIGSALRGAGDTRTPLLVGVVVNIVNVVANWALIFGRLGMPALGVRGSGLATTLAFSIGIVLALALLLGGRLRLRLQPRQLVPRVATIRRVLAIGSPAALEQILMQAGFFLYLMIVARYGTEAIAAYFVGVRILALSFLPGYGFGAAAAALVGQSLGAGKPEVARRAGWTATRLAIGLMSLVGLIILIAARPIAGAFVDDALVIAHTVSFIAALGLAQPLMAIDFTLGGALRGAGDTRFPLVAVLIGFYVLRLGTALLFSFTLQLSLVWVWFALMGDYLARAVLKGGRFRSGRWAQVRV